MSQSSLTRNWKQLECGCTTQEEYEAAQFGSPAGYVDVALSFCVAHDPKLVELSAKQRPTLEDIAAMMELKEKYQQIEQRRLQFKALQAANGLSSHDRSQLNEMQTTFNRNLQQLLEKRWASGSVLGRDEVTFPRHLDDQFFIKLVKNVKISSQLAIKIECPSCDGSKTLLVGKECVQTEIDTTRLCWMCTTATSK